MSINPTIGNDAGYLPSSGLVVSPVLSREAHIAPMVVLVDGMGRSGKTMYGPILASLERVEAERVEDVIEHVGVLHRMGKIHRDAAVTLLRLETDIYFYNGLIGRNTNFRFSDQSSIWKNPNLFRYFKRLLARDGNAVLQRIDKEQPIFQNRTHDQLVNFDLLYEAFEDRLRIVEIVRHPVDTVDSWMRKGWGNRFGQDPLATTICIRHQGQDLPYYAKGWEDIYLESSPLDRVIRMIGALWDGNQVAYNSLSAGKKQQVTIVPFEEFVQRPDPYVQAIAESLGSKTTRHTSRALRRQKIPRTYSVEARREKQGRIESEASTEGGDILKRMTEDYETLVKAL